MLLKLRLTCTVSIVILKAQTFLWFNTISLILPLLTTQLVSGRINLIGQYLLGAKYNLTCEEVDGARPGSFHLRFISSRCAAFKTKRRPIFSKSVFLDFFHFMICTKA